MNSTMLHELAKKSPVFSHVNSNGFYCLKFLKYSFLEINRQLIPFNQNVNGSEHIFFQNGRYIALADYCAVGNSEVNMREGDTVELLKVGCAGWWFVKVIGKLRVSVFKLCLKSVNLQVILWKAGLQQPTWRMCTARLPVVLVAVRTS